MSNIVPDPRTEDQSDQSSRFTVQRHERRLGIKYAASRKAHDVVEETKRAAQRVVLVIDLRVHMTAVGRRNHCRGRLVVRFGPLPYFHFGMGCEFLWHRLSEVEDHEE